MSDHSDDSSGALTEAEAERIAAYVDGRLSTPECQQLEQQVLGNDRLAAGLYAEMNLRRALAPEAAPRAQGSRESSAGTTPARATGTRPRRPAWLQARVLVPMAAALALLIVLPRLLSHPTPQPPVLRGGERVPVGLTPVGKLDAPPASFVWTPDPVADRYRFRLYDRESHLMYETTTRDTTATLASGQISWDAVREAYWVVTPYDGDGGERSSSSRVRFSIVAP